MVVKWKFEISELRVYVLFSNRAMNDVRVQKTLTTN